MLNKIIHFSLNNRLLVLVGAVLLVVGGLFVAKQTEIDVFPDLNAPTVVVMTEANGMAAEEVRRLEPSRLKRLSTALRVCAACAHHPPTASPLCG